VTAAEQYRAALDQACLAILGYDSGRLTLAEARAMFAEADAAAKAAKAAEAGQ
jgi:hypothetical protein